MSRMKRRLCYRATTAHPRLDKDDIGIKRRQKRFANGPTSSFAQRDYLVGRSFLRGSILAGRTLHKTRQRETRRPEHEAMVSTSPPLVVQSDDGSLIAIHHSVATSSTSSSSSQQAGSGGVIRCYDGNVSAGTLKFTLRLPSPSSSSTNDDELVSTTKDDEKGNSKLLRKLIFISSSTTSGADSSPPRPAYLCGMRDISSILIYDIERGVLASSINVLNEDDNAKDSKKKRRKSSIVMNGGVVCDIATSNNNTLYALIYFPTSNDEEESSSKKCRVYEYDLHNSNGQEPRLLRKIKVGSTSSLSSSSGCGGSSTPSFGIHVSTIASTLIVRLGNVLRVLDLTSGSRLAKVDIPPSTNSNSNNNVGGSLLIPSFVSLCVSQDGRHVVTPVDNDRVVLFSYYDKSKLRTMTTLSTNTAAATTTGAEDAVIADIDMTYLDSGKTLVVSTLLAGTAYVFEIYLEDVTTSLVPQMPYMPMIKLQTRNIDSPSPIMNLVSAKFHPLTPETTILCLFQRSAMANRGGSVAGSGTTTLPMETVPYVGIKGTVIVGTSILTKNADTVTDGMTKISKKRKVEGGTVAMAPGDQGQEASMAADLSSSQKQKKKKGDVNEEDNDDDIEKLAEEGDKNKQTEDANNDIDEEVEEEDEQGQTIAERLALLSSAMEESDDDDDEEEGDGAGSSMTTTDKSKFNTKSATSATLTTLLTQALSSNDPTQLNVALQVTDRRLVEGTVQALQSLDAERDNDEEDATTAGYIPTLMAHLVRRMARRHSLVMPLGVWVKAILAATARSATYHVIRGGGGGDKNDDAGAERMAREGREMAMKLGPLKNFLNERVECFPQLLRLEGRLSLLNQQL